MAKKTYEVLSPVNFDGVFYKVGDSIEMEDKHAKSLRESGDIGAPAAKNGTPPEADEDRIAAVAAAIGQVDTKNADLWTKDRGPKSEALAAITGWPVTASDRDAAWTQVKPAA